MDYFQKVIYDDIWGFYLVEDNDNVIADQDADAETNMETKEMFVRKGSLNLELIRHELFHVLFKYTYTARASLTANQMEEVACEIYAYQGKKIDKLAEEVYNELVKLRDGNV